MADRYVFRYGPPPSAQEFFDAWRVAGGYYATVSDEELMRRAESVHAGYAAREGHYEKEGGSHTPELSEAKVIGWKSFKKWQNREDGRLIPVEIVARG